MFLFLGFVFRFHCTRVECWNFLSFFFLISYLVFRLHGIDAAAKTKKWRVFFEKKTRKKMETTESTSSMPSSFFFWLFLLRFYLLRPSPRKWTSNWKKSEICPKKAVFISLVVDTLGQRFTEFYRVLFAGFSRSVTLGLVSLVGLG